jgi:uncharacterized protein (TIGR00288 family)
MNLEDLLAEHESSLAVLVDFENMARPGAKGRADFDIHLVLNRLAEKGRVIVKRAYADWSRYRDARHELMNAGLGLIEMPSAREGAKNRADIQMAVDAMELAYSREHVNTFVIVSGDSDFTPLVGKLRELNKRVIGVGNRESASELLIANCDEFIFYDDLVREKKRPVARRTAAKAVANSEGKAAPKSASGGVKEPVKKGDEERRAEALELIIETLEALVTERGDEEKIWGSMIKQALKRRKPGFNESYYGFRSFNALLEAAEKGGTITLERDEKSGGYIVRLVGNDE